MSNGRLGDLLVAKGVITQEQLRAAEDHKAKNKSRLTSALVKLGHVNEGVLTTFLSQQYGITAISLDDVQVPPAVAKLVPKNLCEKHVFVPLGSENNILSVAISDPTNVAAVDDIRFLCNMEVSVYLATETAIHKLIEKVFGATAAAAPSQKSDGPAGKGPAAAKPSAPPPAAAAAPGDTKAVITMDEIDLEDKTQVVEVSKEKETHEVESEIGNEKPVIKVINKLFVESIKRKASDIHIEPYEQFVRIRFRIDGSLHEVMRLPPTMKTAMAARIKVMSELDISQKRLPQDGRIQVRIQNRKVDVRVSLLPTIFGEKIVMRLLDAGSKTPELKSIGLEEEQFRLFEKAAIQPYGMMLVTGPTGSGKSTTLYAALSMVNGPDVNISTVEDPAEYNMAGVNQTQVKESIGMTFALALRSLLRQDPDVVMVGEIRDGETAEIAIKAALTGHMVFSTLHTNDAPSTISRLKNMGVEPFLITASIILIEAQRLIRINCQNCIQPDPRVDREMLLAAEVPENWLESMTAMRGTGCNKCNNTGFTGRRGIFEVMPMTETLRTEIIKGSNSDELKVAAMKDGLITLRQHGLIKLYRGETTLEEVLNNSRPDGDLT
jgi:type IV pilus assembly protein PilB